jgi:hypothetical protein
MAYGDGQDLILYDQGIIEWIVAEIKGYAQTAQLHLQDLTGCTNSFWPTGGPGPMPPPHSGHATPLR